MVVEGLAFAASAVTNLPLELERWDLPPPFGIHVDLPDFAMPLAIEAHIGWNNEIAMICRRPPPDDHR